MIHATLKAVARAAGIAIADSDVSRLIDFRLACSWERPTEGVEVIASGFEEPGRIPTCAGCAVIWDEACGTVIAPISPHDSTHGR